MHLNEVGAGRGTTVLGVVTARGVVVDLGILFTIGFGLTTTGGSGGGGSGTNGCGVWQT
ncbi:MAG: hypothetical protein ABL859_07805 [Methylotenera sp.]|uniref:hypothetical protein n=1 Tax=Methylotenera sp. TaxID=2051956 RepID=UPI0017AFF396|nr:hypothetical protein [Methylotenera sp.]NOU24039.1 hypothetical protein [Methylotenera sp.]